MKDNQKTQAIDLLGKVMGYRRGTGDYDFSRLGRYDMENARHDAWCDIETEIEHFLNEVDDE